MDIMQSNIEMIVETEGIVLKQVKTVNGRKMLTIFTKKYGKISVGTNLTEGGKNKTALSIRPFTYANYEFFKSRESYNLNSGQVIESFYSIGEDLDKYMASNYALELTEKVLEEEMPNSKLFLHLTDFLREIEKRNTKQRTLLIAYMVKLLDDTGVLPNLDDEEALNESLTEELTSLISHSKFDIIKILKYMDKEPLSKLRGIALEDEIEEDSFNILKKYIGFHLNIFNLKSENVML